MWKQNTHTHKHMCVWELSQPLWIPMLASCLTFCFLIWHEIHRNSMYIVYYTYICNFLWAYNFKKKNSYKIKVSFLDSPSLIGSVWSFLYTCFTAIPKVLHAATTHLLPKVRCSHLSHPTVAMWLHHILSAGSIRQDHIWQSNHTLVCGALFN